MISFMNFMNKRPIEDGEEGQEPKAQVPTRFMSWQDAIFLLVIAALVVGGYYYFQFTKQKGTKQFAECQKLYEANDLLASEACYEKTWELSYVTDSMELERQKHLGLIGDKRTIQMDIFQQVESSLLEGDTSKAFEEMSKMTEPLLLLDQEQIQLWKEWSQKRAIKAAISAAIPTSVVDSSQKP